MIKAYCIHCGVLRMIDADNIASEQECNKVAKKPCPVCSCPYVEEVTL